jgi:hypothetical protein
MLSITLCFMILARRACIDTPSKMPMPIILLYLFLKSSGVEHRLSYLTGRDRRRQVLGASINAQRHIDTDLPGGRIADTGLLSPHRLRDPPAFLFNYGLTTTRRHAYPIELSHN